MYLEINAAGCPNTCRHCSVDGHKPYGPLFTIDQLRAIKKEWSSLTIRYEPTAHPDFPEIYSSDIAMPYDGWLVTNGYGIANRGDYPSLLEKMRQMEFTTLAFTFHGFEEHHDWFVCRKGAYHDLMVATERACEFGFHVNWQIYVDKISIPDLAAFVDLSNKKTGCNPDISIPYHRVSTRLWNYERLRLTLDDVRKYYAPDMVQDSHWNGLLHAEEITAAEWLKKWRCAPYSKDFKILFEPPSWPPDPSVPDLSLTIDHDGKIYLDPMCSPPIYLAKISEGKKKTIEKLQKLPMPQFADISPDELDIPPEEQQQLHPEGFSLRYKEISRKMYAKNPMPA